MNITNFILVFLVNLYWISVRGNPIDTTHIRQVRELEATPETFDDILKAFTNHLITLKVSIYQ